MTRGNDLVGLFDLDGVLADYDARAKADWDKIKSPEEPPYQSFWKGASDWVYARMNLIRNQPGWWESLPRLQAGFDILKVARELGFRIVILTKAPESCPNAWTEKFNWIRKNVGDGTEVSVNITQDKKNTYGRFLVDDSPEQLAPWLENRPRGVGIMPVHSYNARFSHERVTRYTGDNLEEVRKALLWARDRE